LPVFEVAPGEEDGMTEAVMRARRRRNRMRLVGEWWSLLAAAVRETEGL
jgi:hypothetical protein